MKKMILSIILILISSHTFGGIKMLSTYDYGKEYREDIRQKRVFPKYGRKLVYAGLGTWYYGSIFYSIADDPKTQQKGGSSMARYYGNVFYLVAIGCFGYLGYDYYTSNEDMVYIIPSQEKITIAFSKKF